MVKESKEPAKEEWIRFRVDPEMRTQWLALVKARGESEADLGRKIIANAIAQQGIDNSLDEVVAIVRQSLKDVLEPSVERLAKIGAKGAQAAATSMYLNTQVIANVGQDAVSIYEEARKKAVQYVKASN